MLRAPAIPWRMGVARDWPQRRTSSATARVSRAPTLVVTGERELDQVVQADDTMGYLTAIPGAQFQLFERTGHLGTISAPERFAAIVSRFLNG